MPLEEQFLVVFKNKVRRVVEAHVYLVADHVLLLLQFVLFKQRCENYLERKVNGLGDIFFKHGAVNHRLLLCSVGVHVAAQLLQAVVYALCGALFASAEYHVFGKVRQTVLPGRFVGRARLDGEGAVRYCRCRLLERYLESAF